MTKKGWVVDDSRTTAMLLSKMLSAMDFEATTCLSPREALQYLVKTTPDVILLNVNMPGIDGNVFLPKPVNFESLKLAVQDAMKVEK